MPFHRVDKNRKRLERVTPSSFLDQKMRERQHLQALLRETPEAVDADLLIISEEFDSWEGSSRRIDLLGIDKEANLVVIELKRQEDKGHMELQALRYAAMVSAMDFEAVVRAYEEHLAKHGKASTSARQSLVDFLELDDAAELTISSTPRIVLIAPSFAREITTTVLWLNSQGLDIRCVEANLYNLDGHLYLDIEQVIPLPSANEYQIRIRDKTIRAQREVTSGRRRQSLDILMEQALLTQGTRIHLIHLPRPDLQITSDEAKYATFLGTKADGFRWDFDGKTYSLSGLCKAVCEAFGGDIGSGAFAGPDYWALEGATESLAERAKSVLRGDELVEANVIRPIPGDTTTPQ